MTLMLSSLVVLLGAGIAVLATKSEGTLNILGLMYSIQKVLFKQTLNKQYNP